MPLYLLITSKEFKASMMKVSTFAALLAFQVLTEELAAKVKLLVISAPPAATFDAGFEALAMDFP